MKWKLLFLIPIAAFLGGCHVDTTPTGYFSQGTRGGYSELQTAPDQFVVTFKGNAYTSVDQVIKYTYLRASELTIQNNYMYFTVLENIDRTASKTHYWSSGTMFSSGYSSHSSSDVYTWPALSLTIKCHKDAPVNGTQYFDAEFYWNTNKVPAYFEEDFADESHLENWQRRSSRQILVPGFNS